MSTHVYVVSFVCRTCSSALLSRFRVLADACRWEEANRRHRDRRRDGDRLEHNRSMDGVEMALQQRIMESLARAGVRGGKGGAHGEQLKGAWKSSMMLRTLTYVPTTSVKMLPTKMIVFRIVLNNLALN